MTDVELAAHIVKLVDQAPTPLTAVQRSRLALLLAGGMTADELAELGAIFDQAARDQSAAS